jgi:hypothetical protein
VSHFALFRDKQCLLQAYGRKIHMSQIWRTWEQVNRDTALRHVAVGTVFQSDGASRRVAAILNRKFQDLRIGREEFFLLPPSFSRFFLLGVCKKDIVYSEKAPNVNELRNITVIAAECLTNEMLARTWRETEYRLDVCLATSGAHIEIC